MGALKRILGALLAGAAGGLAVLWACDYFYPYYDYGDETGCGCACGHADDPEEETSEESTSDDDHEEVGEPDESAD